MPKNIYENMQILPFRKNYLLISILVVATLLRCDQIHQPFIDGFSWREASTAMMAHNFYQTNWNIFFPQVDWGGAGPNYQGREFQTVSYITALLYVIFGQQDWVGRSVAVVFGVWGIFALYQLVRLVWDEKHALVSAAVMAILPGSIFIERSFLPDPVMVSLMTTCLWMLVRHLKTNKLQYLLLASFFGIWGSLTKITGLIVGIPAIYVVFATLRGKPENIRKMMKISLVMLLSCLPIISYYLWARYLATHYPPYHFAGDGFWLWDDPHLLWERKFFLPQLWRILKQWLWTRAGIVFVFLGLFSLPPKINENLKNVPSSYGDARELSPIKWLFHWWLLGFMFFLLIGSHELYANVWNLHMVNPIAAVLGARGIIVISQLTTKVITSFSPRIPQKIRLKLPLLVIVFCLMILTLIGEKSLNHYHLNNWYAEQSYKLGLALSQTSHPGDLVVTIAHSVGDPVAIYYSHRRGWTFDLADNYPAGYSDTELPPNEDILIEGIKKFQKRGADWLGIVGVHQEQINQKYFRLKSYLANNLQLTKINSEFTIYRFPKS